VTVEATLNSLCY